MIDTAAVHTLLDQARVGSVQLPGLMVLRIQFRLAAGFAGGRNQAGVQLPDYLAAVAAEELVSFPRSVRLPAGEPDKFPSCFFSTLESFSPRVSASDITQLW